MGDVRTLDTNPCVKWGLSTNKMDVEVTISLIKLSQILTVAGISISSSQEEHILTEVKNLSTSPEIIEKPQSNDIKIDSPTKLLRILETWRLHSTKIDLKLKISPHIYQWILHVLKQLNI